MSFSRRGITEGQNKKRKLSLMKKEIKRISLMTAIFLTVTLVSSAVEAGVIRINGIIAGSEGDTPFPDPAEGFYVNGSVTSTDTELGPFTMFYSAPLAFAFLGMPPGDIAGIRLIVGDAANGDSILRGGLQIEVTLIHAPTAIFTLWEPIPLLAERAGTLVLEAASPRTDA
jgi:hypothetical protein